MDVVSPADRETEEPVEGAFLTQVVAGDRMSVQHFRVDPGAGAPEHSHEHEQAGYLVEGSLTILVDGEEHAVGAGDAYLIPGGEPHAVWNPGDDLAVGIELFSPPRARPPDIDE